MEPTAQRVELSFKCGRVHVELSRKSKKSEIVDRDRRLHFAARSAEVHGAHRAARPATRGCLSGHDQRRLGFQICHTKFKAGARPALTIQPDFSADLFAGEGPLRLRSGQVRATLLLHFYYEKELPQPQDLVEFGFTNTNPCCIRVS